MKISESTVNLGLQVTLSVINAVGYAMKTRALAKQQELRNQQAGRGPDIDVRPDTERGLKERVMYRTVIKETSDVPSRIPDMIPVGRLDVAEQIMRLRDLQPHVYRRLEEYRRESDEAERLLLCIELAASIRRALDLGTRCILDRRMRMPYADARLVDRIDMCLPFLGGDAVDLLHRARVLCNRILHGEDIANAAARFEAAARIPGLLVRFIETIADEDGTESEDE